MSKIPSAANIRGWLWPLCLLALCLSGCGKQVASHDEAVLAMEGTAGQLTPEEFGAMVEEGPVDDGWLRDFHDPILEKLVQEALANNPGLNIAQARVEKARGLTRLAGANLKPTVALGGGYRDVKHEGAGSARGGGGAGLGVSWEADVWGRIRSGIAGVEEEEGATVADYQFARQSLAAAVAQGWFRAISSKLLQGFADEVVTLQQQALKITQAKYDIGQGTKRDIHLAKAAVAAAREASVKAGSGHENSLRSLELLLGRYPAADLKAADRLLAVPPPVPSGIPSEILERRPDLVAAEHQVAAAFYRQREAELLHLPRFSFSFGVGLNTINDAIAGLTAGIMAPLYTGGAIEGQVETATAAQQEAIALYAQAALNAFEEVERALAAEGDLLRQEEYLHSEVEENQQAYKESRQQYEIGQIDYLDVLAVQNLWISSRIAAVNIGAQRLINRVQLHLALGGSFAEPAGAVEGP
ncbi:MAG: TolC family protein [Thermodesulfobacteriota bacterium]